MNATRLGRRRHGTAGQSGEQRDDQTDPPHASFDAPARPEVQSVR
jgi:hypothetical protein